MPNYPDVAVAIRNALIQDPVITSLLPSYKGSYPIFTRQPAPTDTPLPFIMIMPNTRSDHIDWIDTSYLRITREIMVFSTAEPSLTESQTVDQIGRAIAELFHRQPQNLSMDDWTVVQLIVTTRGFPPHESLAQSVGFVAVLTVELAAKN